MPKKETIEMLNYIYKDLHCPVCGVKVEFQLNTTGEGFKQSISCEHEEILEKLVEQRMKEYSLLTGEVTSENNGPIKYKFKP